MTTRYARYKDYAFYFICSSPMSQSRPGVADSQWNMYSFVLCDGGLTSKSNEVHVAWQPT